MSSYKKPCIQCGNFIEGTTNFCPNCGSSSPFSYHCPTCKREISESQMRCSDCGRFLKIACPTCQALTFVGKEHCEPCGTSLMINCTNPRCGQREFFENEKCTSCGKKIKKTK